LQQIKTTKGTCKHITTSRDVIFLIKRYGWYISLDLFWINVRLASIWYVQHWAHSRTI